MPAVLGELKGHPLVRQLVHEMRAKDMTLLDLSVTSGVGVNTIYKWYGKGNQPSVANLEACLNAVGLRLTVEPVSVPKSR